MPFGIGKRSFKINELFCDCCLPMCTEFSIGLTSVQPTVNPVLSGHLKNDKTKVLMENGILMKVESIAE